MNKPHIAIFDFGIGNLRSLQNALAYIGAQATLLKAPGPTDAFDGFILPGVGAFGKTVSSFRQAGFEPLLKDLVAQGRPVLGVCVGMQMLFDYSTEFGQHPGLGILPGTVQQLPTQPGTKLPNINWHQLEVPPHRQEEPIWQGSAPGHTYYFVHSFAAAPAQAHDVLAYAHYGQHRFCAAVRRDNLMGVQFHPEKSGPTGLNFLSNFIKHYVYLRA